jgi:hypothetical protein
MLPPDCQIRRCYRQTTRCVSRHLPCWGLDLAIQAERCFLSDRLPGYEMPTVLRYTPIAPPARPRSEGGQLAEIAAFPRWPVSDRAKAGTYSFMSPTEIPRGSTGDSVWFASHGIPRVSTGSSVQLASRQNSQTEWYRLLTVGC